MRTCRRDGVQEEVCQQVYQHGGGLAGARSTTGYVSTSAAQAAVFDDEALREGSV